MHDLAMLREDGGKADALGQRACYAVHLSAHEALGDAGLDEQLGGGVHGIAHVAGALNQPDFIGTLRRAHLHHGLDEGFRGTLFLLCGVYAQEVRDGYLRVEAVGRQEVHGLSVGLRVVYDGLQLAGGCRLADAHLGGQLADRRHVAHPHDVLDVDVVAEQHLAVVVNVDDAGEPVAVLPEEVEER